LTVEKKKAPEKVIPSRGEGGREEDKNKQEELILISGVHPNLKKGRNFFEERKKPATRYKTIKNALTLLDNKTGCLFVGL